MKEEQEIITRILDITKKSAYPTKETTYLATFLDACFHIEEKKILDKQREERLQQELKRVQEQERRRQQLEEQRLKSIEMAAPIPQAPAQLDKKEYVLNIYKNPVGILVEKDQQGKHEYHVIEPHIPQRVLDQLEPIIKKAQEKPTLLDDENFIEKNMIRAFENAKEKYDATTTRKVKYFLTRNTLGTGIIDPIIYDENVREIYIEGNKPIEVLYSNYGRIKTNIRYKDNEKINQLISRLAKETNKVVNKDNPILDVAFAGLKIEGTLSLGGTNSRLTIKRL